MRDVSTLTDEALRALLPFDTLSDVPGAETEFSNRQMRNQKQVAGATSREKRVLKGRYDGRPTHPPTQAVGGASETQ